MNRRQFLGSAAAVATFTIVPRHVLGGARQVPPSEKLNIACIGVGGQGGSDVQSVSSENIVALCDVDWGKHTAQTFEKFPNARKYKDFRKMLDAEEKNIDAVTVGTPDNIHAVAAMAAIKRGKHVYCEKPLCHDVYEVRQLTEAARKQGVMTQMGTQLHATGEMKTFVEWVRAGVIGKIHRVDLWSGKNWGGGERPTDTPPVPATLDWDLWLGPAPYRPYHPRYLPGEWRRWWDFGTGTLGDMGCHIIDPAWWVLDLKYPTSVEAQPGPFNKETYPEHTIVTWEFPARGDLPPVTVTWCDGKNPPPRPHGTGRRAEDAGPGRTLLRREGDDPPAARRQSPADPGIEDEGLQAAGAVPAARDRSLPGMDQVVQGRSERAVELRLCRSAGRGDPAGQHRGPGASRSSSGMGRT